MADEGAAGCHEGEIHFVDWAPGNWLEPQLWQLLDADGAAAPASPSVPHSHRVPCAHDSVHLPDDRSLSLDFTGVQSLSVGQLRYGQHVTARLISAYQKHKKHKKQKKHTSNISNKNESFQLQSCFISFVAYQLQMMTASQFLTTLSSAQWRYQIGHRPQTVQFIGTECNDPLGCLCGHLHTTGVNSHYSFRTLSSLLLLLLLLLLLPRCLFGFVLSLDFFFLVY